MPVSQLTERESGSFFVPGASSFYTRNQQANARKLAIWQLSNFGAGDNSLLCSRLIDGGRTLGRAGPSYYSQRNGNRRPNDEFEGCSFMGHREILALTYPNRKMPPSAESRNSKRSGTTLVLLAAAFGWSWPKPARRANHLRIPKPCPALFPKIFLFRHRANHL
jgi:hypothetical protein